MKRFFVLGLFALIALASSCDSLLGPGKAEIVLDGQMSINMTSYDRPVFMGWVKNQGKNTGYNCLVKIIVYSDSTKKNIIESASGFPGNLGDIAPGQRAYFEAVCFNLSSVSQIVAYDTEITWLDKKGL